MVFVTEADRQQLLQKIAAEVSRIAAGASGRVLNYLEADDGDKLTTRRELEKIDAGLSVNS